MPELALVVAGDPQTLTGGYEYDRRIAAGLRKRGWAVTVHALDASFPAPTGIALAAAQRTLARLPDGCLVLVDGLALGGMPELAASAAARLRLAALVHHPLAAETGLDAARAAALARAERRALGAVRAVIVTSPATAAALAGYGVAAERIAVVEPGTDPAPLARGAGTAALELLCVATLVPRKGHSVLFDALARLARYDWHLTCVGSLARSAETVARLRRQLDELALTDRVTLAGECDRATLAGRYDRADVFALATFHEGYGMALAEALARGLPVVSTSAEAVPGTVPADAGVLVAPGDVGALTDALSRVLTDAAFRARLAAGARRARALLPTWDTACARLAQVLKRVGAPVARFHG